MTGRDERGLSDSVSWTILTPLVFLIVLGIIQIGLWGYGHTVARNAAAAGAEQAALLQAAPGSGEALARQIADAGGLIQVDVESERTATEVTMTVRGHMPSFVNLGQTGVHVQVTRPIERVTTP